MMQSSSREKVLKKVRKALVNKTPELFPGLDFKKPIYPRRDEELEVLFAEQFAAMGGKLLFCEKEEDLFNEFALLSKEFNWKNIFCLDEVIGDLLSRGGVRFDSRDNLLNEIEVGITGCEFLVARTGSAMISSKQSSGRRMAVFPPVHVIIAYTDQVVMHVNDALQSIRKKYGKKLPSMISMITGPSRTADIEKTLILGAHGPKDVYIFLLDRPLQE